MGSYFGSSLCAVDLNQDGLSDLLVGAPMHSQLRDEGQVTVYLSKGNVSDGLTGSRRPPPRPFAGCRGHSSGLRGLLPRTHDQIM